MCGSGEASAGRVSSWGHGEGARLKTLRSGLRMDAHSPQSQSIFRSEGGRGREGDKQTDGWTDRHSGEGEGDISEREMYHRTSFCLPFCPG